MKKHIVKALKWALSKFEEKPEELLKWPFPSPEAVEKAMEFAEKAKKKVTVPKATTRKPAAKKIVKKKAK